MNIGSLNNKIEILEPSGTALNELGETVPQYKLFVRAYANIAPVSGREYIENQKLRPETTYEIILRYYPGIKQNMRVRHKECVYEIVSALNLKGQNEFWKLVCIEDDKYKGNVYEQG